MAKKCAFRPLDVLPILTALVLVGVFIAVGVASPTAAYARVQTPDGEWQLSLAKPHEQVFFGHNGLSVTVTVKDGCVSVTQADCEDQICVHTGTLGGVHRTAVCAPAGIVVTLADDDTTAPDAVTR